MLFVNLQYLWYNKLCSIIFLLSYFTVSCFSAFWFIADRWHYYTFLPHFSSLPIKANTGSPVLRGSKVLPIIMLPGLKNTQVRWIRYFHFTDNVFESQLCPTAFLKLQNKSVLLKYDWREIIHFACIWNSYSTSQPFSPKRHFDALDCLSTCLDTGRWENCYCENRFCIESSKRNRMGMQLRWSSEVLIQLECLLQPTSTQRPNAASSAQWDS